MSVDERFDLGVLFVHGIGNQTEGSTLSEFGTPLIEWLDSRSGQAGQKLVMGATVLAPPDGTPAHSKFGIVGGARPCSVIFAESWWAKSFPIARFHDVAIWSLLITPWTIGTHFASRMRTRKKRAVDFVYRLLLLVAALLMSPLLLLAFGALLVLSWIPLGALRDAVASVQFAIAAWIGDCYMLVVRPIEAAAIRSRVDRDLDWLSSRCKKVAVVAHSQGGAIACQVLDGRGAENCLLVTFGSGLRKLEELAAVHHDRDLLRGARWTAAGLVVVAAAMLAIPYVIYQAVEGNASWLGAVVLIVPAAFGAAVGIAGIHDLTHPVSPTLFTRLGSVFNSRSVQWEDVYATADPVPNGALREDGQPPPRSNRVVNTGSVLRDHTSYWDNRDEFVPLVGEAILAFEGTGVLGPPNTAVLEYARRQREARVAMRRSIGWLTALLAVILIVANVEPWLRIATWASQRSVKYLGGLFGFSPAFVAVPSAAAWGDAVGRLALALMFAWLTSALWNRWNADVMRDAWTGVYRSRPPYAVLTALLVQLVVALVLVTSIDRAVFVGMTGMLLTVVVWAAAGGVRPHPAHTMAAAPSSSSTSSALVVGGALGHLVVAAFEALTVLAVTYLLVARVYSYLAAHFSRGLGIAAAAPLALLGIWFSWSTANDRT
jgi:hypothetical protein